MNEQDKEFLAFLGVWLDWQIFKTMEAFHDRWEKTKSFEEMKAEAKELIKEFTSPKEAYQFTAREVPIFENRRDKDEDENT